MKKLMLLGGIRYLLPVIEEAHKLGIYVITVDNVENNIAHKYSDEFHNVSITDKDAILNLAQDLNIDGIMSFAVDPGVITAAYVADRLNLPKPAPFKSVEILQNKDLFRAFLAKNNFNCPQSGGYVSIDEARQEIINFNFPLIVKPTDSAGSKGVKRIETVDELGEAFNYAKQFSISGKVIVEEFIEKIGETTGSDSFVINGELKYFYLDNQIFDINAPNPYTPIAHKWPTSMPLNHQNELKQELQRLVDLLKIDTSLLNIEARVGIDNKVYIMEVSPRGGGNRLAEILELATGLKLILNSVKFATGMNVDIDDNLNSNINGVWHSEVLFADEEGLFDKIEIGHFAQQYIVDTCIYITQGTQVYKCTGANQTIGTLVYKFNSEDEYQKLYQKVKDDVCIRLM